MARIDDKIQKDNSCPPPEVLFPTLGLQTAHTLRGSVSPFPILPLVSGADRSDTDPLPPHRAGTPHARPASRTAPHTPGSAFHKSPCAARHAEKPGFNGRHNDAAFAAKRDSDGKIHQ